MPILPTFPCDVSLSPTVLSGQLEAALVLCVREAGEVFEAWILGYAGGIGAGVGAGELSLQEN